MARGAYEVMKLAFAEVVQWSKILEEIRTGEKYIALSYDEARESIREFHRTGDMDVLTDAIAELRLQESLAAGERESRRPRNNAEALEGYLRFFTSPFRDFGRAMPATFDTYSLDIAGVQVTGKPHFSLVSTRGKEKFIYLIASKSWSDDEKGLFISLLGEIVAHNVPGASPKDVEGLDCRTGERIVRTGLGVHHRNRVEQVAAHLLSVGLH